MRELRGSESPDRNLTETQRPIVVVMAVKELNQAKTRLAGAFSDALRADLVLGMYLDVLDAVVDLADTPGGAPVTAVVVSPDEIVRNEATRRGGLALDDPVRSDRRDSHGGSAQRLNDALLAGARHARELLLGAAAAGDLARPRMVFLQADLPAITTDVLRQALAAVEQTALGHTDRDQPATAAVVSDRRGTGTAMLIADDTTALDGLLGFGPDSATVHRSRGAVDLVAATSSTDRSRRQRSWGSWEPLRTDVDTIEDLHAAAALGVGAHTAAVLQRLPIGTSTAAACRTR
ncbi:hypothetical protein GCM10027169_12620 [Gordonia jinhuaensis]|uniref:Phosphoenolpyruvate guanylyltransferase n=1 Tax=Gordonia jinhuaensis TaxID=1517702 RepID=A0A916WPH5_9ACTN|nr:hypothetical protein [Gordonia jinhuaensis]GGB22185.1 hypothetical protein GCM10011489_07950 [Gordonia jinhuaensis]